MATDKQARRKEVKFPKRITIILDEDAQELANFAGRRSDWVSQAHFINAAVRRVMAPFAPGIRVRKDAFEQLAFAKPLKVKP